MSRATTAPFNRRANDRLDEPMRWAADGERETPDVETSSETYAQRFSGKVGVWFLHVQEQAILQMMNAWPNAAVLEVGGGHGQLTGALIRQGHRVTVLGSDRNCQQRIRPLVQEGLCRFVTGNLLSLPYSSQTFDVVVSVRLLPHVVAWPRLIAELSRVARHAVIVDYPTSRSLNCLTPALFGAKKRFEGSTRPYRLFREKEVAEAFAQQGFVAHQRYPQFFAPMVVHRMLGLPTISAGVEGTFRTLQLTRYFGSPVVALFVRRGRG